MPTGTRSQTITEKYFEAMRHPLRKEIWRHLHEYGVSNPKKIADVLGETLQDVAYHTKRLEKLGCAELVDKRQVRGAVQHRYRAIRPLLIDDDEWNYLVENWPEFADQTLGELVQVHLDEIRRSVEAGILGRDHRFVLSRTPVIVDAKGREELLELLIQVEKEEVVEIVQRSKERRANTNEDGIPMAVLLSGIPAATR